LYYAHKENKGKYPETVSAHLRETAALAAGFTSIWDRRDEGFATGILHDLGKYTDLFKQVLEGKAQQVDHATPGAHALLKLYKEEGVAAALAAQGHHDGLQVGRLKDLSEALKMKEPVSSQNKTYSSRDVSTLLKYFQQDNLKIPPGFKSDYLEEYKNNRSVAAMFYARMLYSALVDADFLATEAHYNSNQKGFYKYRPAGNKLEPEVLLATLLEYMVTIKKKSNANKQLDSLRNDLFNTCLENGGNPKGIYTLAAPTGAGKTLSTLAFALNHAAKHKLRRIIFVMPYLNIIEQNALVYREVFQKCGDGLVLEDHSMIDLPEEQRLFAENWDAPIIVTTTVRFFEGMFANRSSACRRLHNIASSVIIFDEAQSLPPQLAISTLAAISYLVERFGCTAVFSTATQPTFEMFNDQVKCYTNSGWQPLELVPQELKVFKRTRKVQVRWRDHLPWSVIASEIIAEPRALAIVNTRKQARILYKEFEKQLGTDKNLHFLSTDMCPAHRLSIIKKIKTILARDKGKTEMERCYLVSTQCVEAGVDLDFPMVWRALGPLEAIIQAAGRCNRQGNLAFGKVVVFRPPVEDENYPDAAYGKGAVEVLLMLEEKGIFDIEDPKVIREYYQRYFLDNLSRFERVKLAEALQQYDFLKVAQEYRWIRDSSINILVPYKEKIKTYYNLCELARGGKFNRAWIKKSRPLSIGHRLSQNSDVWFYLEPVTSSRKEATEATGWYILLDKDRYDNAIGFRSTG
jgi:CRISPR-associated helicase Cas3/CRISPR-associated endonuclease Cas3-HD